jgi:hypothetical protein
VREGRRGYGTHTFKTGVQGGHVDHRRETEVKFMQKEEGGGEEGRQKIKNKK